ncbi:MAG: ferredoxin family protein [bacterium]
MYFFCPANVFTWDGDKINVHYGRCLECGACPWGCPHENINWSFPPGGWGVRYGQN